MSGEMAFCLEKKLLLVMNPAFLEVTKQLCADRKKFLACTTSAWPSKLSLISSFRTTFPILFPVPLWGGGRK